MGEYDRGKGPEGGHQSVETIERDGTIAEPDVQAVRAVLERPRRRALLEIVTEHGPVTTRDLTTLIGATLHDVAPSAVTDDQRTHLSILLHHVDVPKLVAVRVLDADEGLDRIRPGPKAELVRSVLRDLTGASDGSSGRSRID